MGYTRPYGWDVIKLLIVILAIGSALLSISTIVSADNVSDKAPYYNNTSVSWDNETWIGNRTDPTVANTTNLLTRVSTFVVGTGGVETGGLTSAGAIITGLLSFGVVLGLTAGSRVGPVAGAVVGTSTVFGLSAVGLAPGWLWPVALFALGLLLVGPIHRVFR